MRKKGSVSMNWLSLLQPHVLAALLLVLLLLRRWAPWVRCVFYIAICVLACWRLAEWAKNGPAMLQNAAMRIGMQYAPEQVQASIPSVNRAIEKTTAQYNEWVVPGVNTVLRPFGRELKPKSPVQLPTAKQGPWWHAFLAFDLGYAATLFAIVGLDFSLRLLRVVVALFPHFWGWFWGKKTLPV